MKLKTHCVVKHGAFIYECGDLKVCTSGWVKICFSNNMAIAPRYHVKLSKAKYLSLTWF